MILALGGNDGSIQLVNASDGGQITLPAGHEAEVTVLAFSPDGKRLATGSADTSVLIWDLTHTALNASSKTR